MTPDNVRTSDLGDWLTGLGLGQYAPQFEAAGVDMDVLPHLSDDDLKDLGIPLLGHRKKILVAASVGVGVAPTDESAEMRYLTVVFCDLVGSTPLAEALGAEAYSEVLNGFYNKVREAVVPLGGHVAQYYGDGVLIYFGYPTAVEDAALRGVMGALRAMEAVRQLPRSDEQSLSARIGVASGLVVVDARHSDGPGSSGRAFGPTVNLAARIQSETRPDTIAISDTTANLVRDHFDLAPLGKRRLKGIEGEVPMFLVERPHSEDLGMAMLGRPIRVDLYGRDDELAWLRAGWARSLRGSFTLATLGGDPGIGKSRLARELLLDIEAEGHGVRRLLCHPQATDIPFHPILRELALAKGTEVDGAAEVLERFDRTGVQSWSDRRQSRSELIDALVSHYSDGGEAKALWIDDLQWADPSTLETLSALIAARPAGLMIVVGTRDPSAFASRDQGIDLFLTPLPKDGALQIVQQLLKETGADASLAKSIAARSEGVPIFAEELALEVRSRLANGDALNPGQLFPSSLQQSIQARIGRLTVGRPLMRVIASLDRSVPLPVLRDLWQGRGPIEPALNEIVQAGLAEFVLTKGDGAEHRIAVRHQLILDCAYDMILQRDRDAIHSEIADALERREASGIHVVPRLRADQLEKAGRTKEAAEFWALAGRNAASQSSYAEAVSLFKRALALVQPIQSGDQADAEWADQFEADTHLALYPAMIGAFGYRAAGSEITVGIQNLISRVGGAKRLLSSVFLQWLELLAKGDIDGAHEFTTGLSPAIASDETGVHELVIHRMMGSTHMFRGDFPEAMYHLEAFKEIYEPARHSEPLKQFGATDNNVTVLCCVAAIEAIIGDEESTQRAVNEAVAAAEATGHAHTMCHTLVFGAALPAGIRGRWDRLDLRARQLRTIVSEHGLSFWGHFAEALDGIAQCARGELDAGRSLFLKGTEQLQEHKFLFMGPTFRLVLAQACGRHFGADELDALERDLSSGERWLVPACRELRAGSEAG